MTDTVEKRFCGPECATLIQNRGRVRNFDSNTLLFGFDCCVWADRCDFFNSIDPKRTFMTPLRHVTVTLAWQPSSCLLSQSVHLPSFSCRRGSAYYLNPSCSCHKWRPYLVSPYKESGNGAIEELNWVPTLCHRRQQRKEQTHVTVGFAAANCRLRANLEL